MRELSRPAVGANRWTQHQLLLLVIVLATAWLGIALTVLVTIFGTGAGS